ncbi:MAG: hypothetical protein J1E28_06285 [Helicobacter sp.]|uniref:hypothetical protein n=1 Tax=Helicobacter sp. TaxID=218 RepID=UPI0025BAC825|nr:hypothetical protein [Helicobacter sp.]MCH5313979.1 hypothetical protein [Helicobacter sp.]
MLSQERLEDIASLNPTQALSKEQKREQFHSLVILALLSQNMLWILTKDFYTKKYEYRAECREIEYRAQDWLMAQTTQDFTRIGCVNKEDCKNKESVHSRWFKRHFECRYFDDEGKLYPLNEECAQILKHTRFQVALLFITTLKDMMSLRQAYNQHYELAKARYLAACEAGLESYMCENPQYFYSQGIHSFVLETEGICPPLQPIP